jgi:hypothetical protein
MGRKNRRTFEKNITKKISELVILKNGYLLNLETCKLTLEEVQSAMQGTFKCINDDAFTTHVNKVAKRLLEVNEELIILAQHKSKVLAVRDNHAYKTPIPDDKLLPHGSNTRVPNVRT